MPAVNFHASRTPWAIALTVLFLIWTVKFLQAPAVSHLQPVSPVPAVGKEAPVAKPNIPKPSLPSEASNIQGGGAHVAAPNSEKEAAVEESAKSKEAAATSTKAATPQPTSAKAASTSPTDRPLVLYAYSETPNARTNLIFFLAHGLHQNADFVFVMNGESSATALIPNKSNIRIVQRENDCYDLGAYAEVLTTDDFYKSYQRYILMNASIRGPFVPTYATGCWSDMYLGKITDKVKLVGMTGNCQPIFHVQSMIWATDRTGIELLLHPPADPKLPADKQEVGINSCFHTWETAVHAEVYATQIILAAGYEASVMMSAFHAKKTFVQDCDKGGNGDALWNGKYYGTNVHPYETVFMKSNRDIDPILMTRLTEWTDGSGYSSYDHC
ncbi:hypothetical protein V495_00553 [Pseudogymnoascus sp. VKM F-4514 (FW-929)]|nr:hypothetical protein V495_00553 [Pseudogymnoascus sp. VKM F-4514 (FW-929)]KFY66343.1 hypothetical protein V497_01005 [Pseudogymnoascus sp. VKM F-4516 (FW-969)]